MVPENAAIRSCKSDIFQRHSQISGNRLLQENQTFFNGTRKFSKSDICQWYPNKLQTDQVNRILFNGTWNICKSDIFQRYPIIFQIGHFSMVPEKAANRLFPINWTFFDSTHLKWKYWTAWILAISTQIACASTGISSLVWDGENSHHKLSPLLRRRWVNFTIRASVYNVSMGLTYLRGRR